eukprot:2742333-Pleurochrysis_carterae.AAC.2
MRLLRSCLSQSFARSYIQEKAGAIVEGAAHQRQTALFIDDAPQQQEGKDAPLERRPQLPLAPARPRRQREAGRSHKRCGGQVSDGAGLKGGAG